jgi:hypothetical protein
MILDEEEARRIAHAIAFGHAYWKHAAHEGEEGAPITESSFEQLILETLLNPTNSRVLRWNRSAFWNEMEGLLVIHNPTDPEMGTAYWPEKGRNEYESLF